MKMRSSLEHLHNQKILLDDLFELELIIRQLQAEIRNEVTSSTSIHCRPLWAAIYLTRKERSGSGLGPVFLIKGYCTSYYNPLLKPLKRSVKRIAPFRVKEI